MRVRWFAITSFFFCLLASQTLQFGEAQGWCCPCTCMPTCTCAGKIDPQQGRCFGCFSIDNGMRGMASAKNAADDPTVQASSYLSTILSKSEMNSDVIDLRMRQSCLRGKVVMVLIGGNQDSFRYQTLAFNSTAD